jgi:hypothetical protein
MAITFTNLRIRIYQKVPSLDCRKRNHIPLCRNVRTLIGQFMKMYGGYVSIDRLIVHVSRHESANHNWKGGSTFSEVIQRLIKELIKKTSPLTTHLHVALAICESVNIQMESGWRRASVNWTACSYTLRLEPIAGSDAAASASKGGDLGRRRSQWSSYCL